MSNEAWLPNAIASAMNNGMGKKPIDVILERCKLLMEPFGWKVSVDDGPPDWPNITAIRFRRDYPCPIAKQWKSIGYQWPLSGDDLRYMRTARDENGLHAMAMRQCEIVMADCFQLLAGEKE